MADDKQTITVRINGVLGETWSFPIEPYITLWDFITSTDFLNVTKCNPNKLKFTVNSASAEDDLLLLPGDLIVVHNGASEKALISPKDVIRKIDNLKGVNLLRHGSRHDIWLTADGYRFSFPRHRRELSKGLLQSILKQAQIDMSIEEFVSV